MKSLLCLTVAIGISSVTFAASAPKPDSDMKTVLDAFKDQKPKPLDTLSAEEARQQPTPADATKAVITKKEGKFTPTAMFKVEDRMIQGAEGMISSRIYWPSKTTGRLRSTPMATPPSTC